MLRGAIDALLSYEMYIQADILTNYIHTDGRKGIVISRSASRLKIQMFKGQTAEKLYLDG